MLTAQFHDAGGQLVRMQSDAQGAINEVLAAGKRAAGEACRMIPGVPQGANVTGSGSVQESSVNAANICQRPVPAPMPLMGRGFGAPSSPYASPYVSPYASPYGGLGGLGQRNVLGGAWEDAVSFASSIINGAQGAAADVCKVAPIAQIVAGAAGSGSVQSAAERVNAICGNQPVGTAASTGNVLPKSKYPASCATRFNKTTNTWSVYCPGGTVPSGFGDAFGMLGAVSPAPPIDPATGQPMVKVASEASAPQGTPVASPSEEKELAWWQNWKFWAAVGGGVAVVGGGSYLIFRRKR